MTIRYSPGQFNSLLEKIKADQTLCFIDLYSGAQPSVSSAAPTGTKLGVVTLDGDGITGVTFDTPVLNVMTKPPAVNWQFTGLAIGTIGYFRVREAADDDSVSNTLKRIDGSVGTTSGDMILPVIVMAVGTPGVVGTATITLTNS